MKNFRTATAGMIALTPADTKLNVRGTITSFYVNTLEINERDRPAKVHLLDNAQVTSRICFR